MNRFAYAEANPWTFSDPSGHATCYSSSDLCDETIAIKHQGTQAARDAARRISSRYKVNYWWNLALRAGLSTRAYESTPQSTPETVPADQGWGENASIARASAAGASAQSAGVRCAPSRFGTNCQNAQQQADSAATSAGIGDAFGDIWNSALHLGSCVGNVLNCADVGLGLTMMALNPIGAGQAIADQRLAAIQSGDKRAGAHAITSTVIDISGLALLPLGGGAADAADVADSTTALTNIADFADNASAFIHYAKHVKGIQLGDNGAATLVNGGADMPELGSFAAYRDAARQLMGGASSDGVLQGVRGSGAIFRLDPSTGQFGVRSPEGVIRTFFRPQGGPSDWLSYFLKQFDR